jgi:DNA-binding CsgD family transcriptional regulator
MKRTDVDLDAVRRFGAVWRAFRSSGATLRELPPLQSEPHAAYAALRLLHIADQKVLWTNAQLAAAGAVETGTSSEPGRDWFTPRHTPLDPESGFWSILNRFWTRAREVMAREVAECDRPVVELPGRLRNLLELPLSMTPDLLLLHVDSVYGRETAAYLATAWADPGGKLRARELRGLWGERAAQELPGLLCIELAERRPGDTLHDLRRRALEQLAGSGPDGPGWRVNTPLPDGDELPDTVEALDPAAAFEAKMEAAALLAAMTSREAVVARRRARGQTETEIAADLGISVGAVRQHWARIKRKARQSRRPP